MLLGFISLLLAVTQDYISKICIPASLADKMLPCRKEDASSSTETAEVEHFVTNFVAKFSQNIRRLAEEDDTTSSEVVDSCTAKVCVFQ